MTDYHMWEYWRDKYGYEDALKDYYPDDVANTRQLEFALSQLKMAEIMIDTIMKGKEDYG
jgi:hypothetical protein